MSRLSKSILQRFRKPRHLPLVPRHSDVWLVEFPKSGVTWLSTLIGNIALIESGRSEIATFATSSLYVPDIHVSRDIGELPYHSPPCRFLKSHATYNTDYHFVIYLARHPLAVMKSYYTFLNSFGTQELSSFDDFVESKDHGIASWRNHVRSWLLAKHGATRLFVLRYEDLLQDPNTELVKISEAFGWSFSTQSIETAILRSSVRNMAANEASFRQFQTGPENAQFVRKPFKGEIDETLVSRIEEACAAELELLGYTGGAATA